MTSRRSWLLGLALGAAVTVGSMQDAQAQAPRTFTYQGQLLNNGQPDNGTHTVTINFYTDQNGGSPIASVPVTGVLVTNGIFNIEVGQGLAGGLPSALTFNQQYFIGVQIDGGAELPRTRLHSAPYAINANSVNGIGASTTAQPGMLYPLNSLGKIDPAVLPDATPGVMTINGVGPSTSGNVTLAAGSGVVLNNDVTTNTITITAQGGTGIENIILGDGLIGGGTPNQDGEVMISLAPNAVDATMIGNGVITGMKLNALIAGEGLYQDILGNLNVGVDNQSLEINADVLRIKALGVGTTQLADGAVTTVKIADGAVTAAKVNPNEVQLRVNGVAPAGSFITGINVNGTVNSGTVNVNPTLTRTVNGSNLDLALNLANPNTWTGAQTFNGGATASTLTVTGATTTNGITNTGNIATTTLNSTGNVTVGGNLAVTGTTTLTGAATTNGITNNGTVTTTTSTTTGNATVGGTLGVTGVTTTNGINNTGNINTTTLATTGAATVGTTLAVGGAITAPAGGHVLGTTGMDQTVLTVRGVPGAGNTELVVQGDASFNGNTTLTNVNATTVTATTVNTSNLGGNGGNITLTSDVNANTRTINNGVYQGYTLRTGNIAVGETLTNNGTILGGTLQNATINGGTINNTIIGNTTPAAGTFTTLNSTGLATLQQLQVNSSMHADGLATFGTAPASNGNKVIIDGVVSPFPIGSTNDYELIVNGDAQVTGTLWAGNFATLVLAAPTIKFDNAMPYTPGGDMTFGGGNVNFDGGGLVGDVVNIYNIPGGAYGMHITAQSGTSGMKVTGQPGSLTAIDIDPFATGINVDATTLGINIINAPTSLRASGIIDAQGTILNSVGNLVINDALDQTGAGQVTFSGNVDANNGLDVLGTTNLTGALNQAGGQNTFNGNVDANAGLDVTGASTFAGTMTQTGGGQITLSGNVDANGGVDVNGLTTMNGNLQFVGAGNTISNNASTQVTIADGINQTGGTTNNFSGTIAGAAAGNTLGSGANATQLTINGVNGGATELVVNGDASITGSLTSGSLLMLGNIDMNFNDIVNVDDIQFNTATADLSNLAGDVVVNDNLVVTGTSDLRSSVFNSTGVLNLNDATQITGTLDAQSAINNTTGNNGGQVFVNDAFAVTGTSDLQGAVSNSTGVLNLNDATQITGTLDAQQTINNTTGNNGGQVFVGDNFAVTGTSDLQNSITNTTGNNGGVVHVNDNFTVTGATVLQGTLDAQQTINNTTGNNGGQVFVGDNFAVTGTSDLQNTISNTTGNNGGQVFIGDNLAVTGTSDLQNTISNTTGNNGGQVFIGDNLAVTGTSDLQGSISNTTGNNGGAVHVNDAFTQVNGNVSMASTAGNTTAIGNTTGTMALTGSTITVSGTTNINTTGDFNTSIGNAAGATNNTTIGVGTGGNLTLNGVDADALPTQWLTLNGSNQVRTTLISGTANEGVSWDATQGRYELGSEVANAVPFSASPRYVDVNNSTLNVTRFGGAEMALQVVGGTMGAVNIQPTNGPLNLGNDLGLNTINGRTVADGSGMTPAGDVITINNVPNTFDGLQIDAGQGASAGARINTTGTANGTGLAVLTTNTGATNTGIAVDVSGGTTSNFGQTISVNGTAATGLAINANNAVGSTGETIIGAVNGVNVTLPNATNGAAYIANLDAGDNQTGLRVDMNGGGGSAAGVSISEIGGGTGAVIDMTGASGATGLNVLAVGTNTGISVQSVTGGGVGISSAYTDNGAGSAIQASTTSTNTTSEAIRATGVAGGGAAIDVAAGGVDATAAVGARFSDTAPGGPNLSNLPITINNTVARANSTIILTYKNTTGGGTVGQLYISSQANGSFQVTKTALWSTGDQVEYVIINHGS